MYYYRNIVHSIQCEKELKLAFTIFLLIWHLLDVHPVFHCMKVVFLSHKEAFWCFEATYYLILCFTWCFYKIFWKIWRDMAHKSFQQTKKGEFNLITSSDIYYLIFIEKWCCIFNAVLKRNFTLINCFFILNIYKFCTIFFLNANQTKAYII